MAVVQAHQLSDLELFAGCDAAELKNVADRLVLVDVDAGAVVARQGDAGESFLLIADGEAEISRDEGDGAHVVGIASPGAIVGELALLRHEPRAATVTALRPVRGYAGDAGALAALFDAPEVGERVARAAHQRLAANARPVPAVLRDGTRIALRPVLPTDKEKVVAALDRFSAESFYKRFFSRAELSDRSLDYLTDLDYDDHFAWVAVSCDEPDTPMVAVARYHRLSHGSDVAELAFAVIDEYQGRGLATLLLGALAVAARENGVRRFEARTLRDNDAMRAVLNRAGAHWDWDEPGLVHTVFDVPRYGAHLSNLRTAAALRAAVRDIGTASDFPLAS